MKRSLRYYIQSLHFKFLSLVSSSFSSSGLLTRDTLTASTSRRFSSRRPSNGSPLFSFCTLKKENFLFNSPILLMPFGSVRRLSQSTIIISSPAVSLLKFDINFNSNWPVVVAFGTERPTTTTTPKSRRTEGKTFVSSSSSSSSGPGPHCWKID